MFCVGVACSQQTHFLHGVFNSFFFFFFPFWREWSRAWGDASLPCRLPKQKQKKARFSLPRQSVLSFCWALRGTAAAGAPGKLGPLPCYSCSPAFRGVQLHLLPLCYSSHFNLIITVFILWAYFFLLGAHMIAHTVIIFPFALLLFSVCLGAGKRCSEEGEEAAAVQQLAPSVPSCLFAILLLSLGLYLGPRWGCGVWWGFCSACSPGRQCCRCGACCPGSDRWPGSSPFPPCSKVTQPLFCPTLHLMLATWGRNPVMWP